MSLFTRRKDDPAATRESQDFSGEPGITDYQDDDRLAPGDPRRPASPTDPGRRSWFGVAKRAVTEFKADNITDWSAALTYYAVLSIFPGVIVFVALLGLFGQGAATVDKLISIVGDIGVPQSAVDSLRGPIEDVVNQQGGKAGLALVLGIAGALWSASGYIGAFTRAMNAIYGVREGRKFYILRPLQILITVACVLLLTAITLALVTSGSVAKAVGDALGLGQVAVTTWNIAKWPVIVIIVSVMIAGLYHVAPNVKHPRFRWFTLGSVLALVLWVVASAAFGFYVANFGSYDKTYGSLGAVISFLVWMWITNNVLLFGGEVNAEVERDRAGRPADEEVPLPPRRVRR